MEGSKLQKNAKTTNFYIIIFILTLIILGYLIYGFHGFVQKNSANPDDFIMRYRESKYVERGINPFDVMNGSRAIEPDIGGLWEQGGSVPWAIGIGVITNFTFLPEMHARFVSLVFTILSMFFVALIAYKFCRKKYNSQQSLIAALACISMAGWGTGIDWINYGAILGALLFIFVFIEEDHPYIAGLILGIASIKPQLAAPFYLAVLLKRNWRSFFVSCCIPLAGWIYTILITNTSPFHMTQQMMKISNSYMCNSFFSTYSLLFNVNIGKSMTDILSIFGCIVSALILWRLMHNRKDNLVYYSIPAVLSGMWMYSQEHDRTVLAIYILALIILLYETNFSYYKKTIILTLSLIITWPQLLDGIWKYLFTESASAYTLLLSSRYTLQIISLIILVTSNVAINYLKNSSTTLK